jgi:hypothetical protein
MKTVGALDTTALIHVFVAHMLCHSRDVHPTWV